LADAAAPALTAAVATMKKKRKNSSFAKTPYRQGVFDSPIKFHLNKIPFFRINTNGRWYLYGFFNWEVKFI